MDHAAEQPAGKKVISITTVAQLNRLTPAEFAGVEMLNIDIKNDDGPQEFQLDATMPNLKKLRVNGGWTAIKLSDKNAPQLEHLIVEGGDCEGAGFRFLVLTDNCLTASVYHHDSS